MALDKDTDIQYLKGVGEKRAALYRKLGIHTVGELLRHFPRSYLDLSDPCPIQAAPLGEAVVVRARVVKKSGEQRIRKGMSIFKVLVADDTGELLLTFFNAKYTVEALKPEEEYLFHGRVSGNLLRREMSAPAVFPARLAGGLLAIYPQTAGLTSRSIGVNIAQALRLVLEGLADPLPPALRQRYQLCHLHYALEEIHHPSSKTAEEVARRRLIFEELFTLSIALTWVKAQKTAWEAPPLAPHSLEDFYQSLPFAPTSAQLRAVADICGDLTSGRPMNRLVQGDVGSGKTLVAAAGAYFVWKNGGQSAMMAPTEILAEQHHRTLSGLLEPLGVGVGLLTGSMTAKARRQVRERLLSGEIGLLVGTHALLSQGVDFENLTLVITDEQHRFGVNQRTALSRKGEQCHTLVMSATPIPRTLSLIIYGDLDISVIDEMPVGRLPVRTYRIDSGKRQRAFGFIRSFLDRGLQAYIVCPLVEAGEESDPRLVPATEYAKEIAAGPFARYRVGLLHGKMKAADKDRVMRAFQQGEIQLLVATTVIEVGVDVPNAAVILIENAERFGLSQLHQLRGRVGRGAEQSHCILLSDSKGEDSVTRLRAMCATNSGFAIAEQDLSLRGPGDFFGSRQHGLPQLHIADMVRDMELLAQAQQAARQVLDGDEALAQPGHLPLRQQVEVLLGAIGERPN